MGKEQSRSRDETNKIFTAIDKVMKVFHIFLESPWINFHLFIPVIPLPEKSQNELQFKIYT